VFDLLQDRSIRVSWKRELRTDLKRIFAGGPFVPLLADLEALHQRVLHGRVFVALHMHAGDGNVHTNIPVNSDDYAMLQAANRAVARIMQIARDLGGVISGEHGIGITKLEFLTESETADFRAYKERIDPQGRFNAGKLLPGADLRNAYTPSFNLLGHESLIMQQSDIAQISDAIKDCLRCGKCKPVCSTHVPGANLLYSPRNKILATSMLIEAFLYEEQTRRGISLQHWDAFGDVADHCTVCHKCETPCPVDIDFGDVSMAMRDVLRRMGNQPVNPAKSAAMFFLNTNDPGTIKLTRKLMIDWGYKAQRVGHQTLGKLGAAQTKRPPATTGGRPPLREQVIHFINKKMPGGLPKKTARALLDVEDRNYVPDHPRPGPDDARLRGGVLLSRLRLRTPVLAGGLATQAMLWHAGRADGVAAGLPVLRLSAARLGPVRPGRKDHHRQPRAVPPRGEHAQLPGHQDGRGELRHLPRPAAGLRVRADLPGIAHPRHPRVPARERHPPRARDRRPLHVSRPLPLADEDARPAQGRQCIAGHSANARIGRNDRCCGESGYVCSGAARHRHAGALPQAARDGTRRRESPGRRLCGRREGADVLPVVPAGPVAVRRRRGHRGRLHRGRDGTAPARPDLARVLRATGERGRHRARPRLNPVALARRTGGDFAWRWRVVFGWQLLVQLAGFIAVAPLVGWLTDRIVARSGSDVVSNYDIARFVLSPAGLVFVVLVVATTIAFYTSQLAGYAWISGHAIARADVTLRGTIGAVAQKLRLLVRLGARMFVRTVLLALPFLAIVAIVWFATLAGRDINYYLAEHPPEWRRALLAAAWCSLGFGFVLVAQFARWIFVMPIAMFHDLKAAQVLDASERMLEGRLLQSIAPLALWALLLTGTAALCSASVVGSRTRRSTGRASIPSGYCRSSRFSWPWPSRAASSTRRCSSPATSSSQRGSTPNAGRRRCCWRWPEIQRQRPLGSAWVVPSILAIAVTAALTALLVGMLWCSGSTCARTSP
jgi:heterodisulfide reductase subunit C